ncbi:MAG: hypothetical protein ACE5G8_14220, partial [Anaerolineae bacterium]
HGPSAQAQSPEASPVFDLWFIAADGSVKAKVWDEVGMWSNPVWHSQGVAFGRATTPLQSVDSRYRLSTVDWDGSNPRTIFPTGEQPGPTFPEMAWKPGGEAMIFVYQNNLYLVGPDGAPPQPLTSDGQSHRPVWVAEPAPPVTPSPPLTATTGLTQTAKPAITNTLSATTTITP